MGVTMDSNRPTVVGNVIMVSGDITSGIGNTFDASPYMNEIISAQVLPVTVLGGGLTVTTISVHTADADNGLSVNMPGLYCRFSGTTLTVASRQLGTGDGEDAASVNAVAIIGMAETTELECAGKFLIIGRK